MIALFQLILPKTRKGWIKFLAVIIGICLLAETVVLVLWSKNTAKPEERGLACFNQLPQGQLEDGLKVYGSIVQTMGAFAESSLTFKDTPDDRNSMSLFYVIPVMENAEDGTWRVSYFLTYEALTDEYAKMQDIEIQTWTETESLTELRVDNGEIVEMDDEMKELLDEWAVSPDFYDGGSFVDWCLLYNILDFHDSGSIRARLAPYIIVNKQTGNLYEKLSWVIMIIAVLAIARLLYVLFRKKNDGAVADTEELPEKPTDI